MLKIEEIIDKAIQRSLKGEDISALLSACSPQQKEQVTFAVQTAKRLSEIGTNTVPQPIRRRLYANIEEDSVLPSKIISYLKSIKISYAVTAAVLFIAISGTVQAAMSSIPGGKLFFIKKNIELAQIKLTRNPEKRAEMQLTFAIDTLNGAKQAVQQNDPQQTQAAVSEVNQQTAAALNNVKSIASTAAVQDPSIINNAEKLANESSNLVAKVDPSAKQSIQQNLQAIKNIVSAATNEQDNASIPTEKIDITGTIKSVNQNSLSIDSNTFQINSDTKIQDQGNNNISQGDLKAGEFIKLQGHTKDSKNIAENITILPTKINPIPPVSKPTDQDNAGQNGQDINQNNQAQTPVIPVKPKDTFGGFIVEPATGF